MNKFISIIDEKVRELKGGEYISVTYNGSDSLSMQVGCNLIFCENNIHLLIAEEVERFLIEKNFVITKFRVSPYAYEGILKKKTVIY